MEWRVYLRYKEVSYRAFKVRQGSNGDITIIPKFAIPLSRNFLSKYSVGDTLKLSVDKSLVFIDHYSAHSRSGQRHVKVGYPLKTFDPINAIPFKSINTVIPLATLITGIQDEMKDPNPKGKWFGYTLPDDVSYVVFDISAFPLNNDLHFKQSLQIYNEKKTSEFFYHKVLQLRNLNLCITVRSSNHGQFSLRNNILFQQDIGKSAALKRVVHNEIQVDIVENYV
mgnify:CR=1 FL=1